MKEQEGRVCEQKEGMSDVKGNGQGSKQEKRKKKEHELARGRHVLPKLWVHTL